MNERISLSAVLKTSRIALKLRRHFDVERIEKRRRLRRDLEAEANRQTNTHTESTTHRGRRAVRRIRVTAVANESRPGA
jgi:hypothetical protein